MNCEMASNIGIFIDEYSDRSRIYAAIGGVTLT